MSQTSSVKHPAAHYHEATSGTEGTGASSSASPAALSQLCVVRAANDLVFSEDGQEYIDLFSGCGTVFLGHGNPAIAAGLREQLDKVWITGVLPTPIAARAKALIEAFFPSSHHLLCLYSTGMEAAEFALRVARVATGKSGCIGFDRCMHGKSMAAAFLGWHNDLVTMPDIHRLPYLPSCSEAQILEHLEATLAKADISAVFLEPLQGSAGAHMPSVPFFHAVARSCAEHGALLVMDEILTGFYRTGAAFVHQEVGITPDIVLIGKAMGNGFPVSGVVAAKKYFIEGRMLPGSTYAGSPLAASAVVATLHQLKQLELPSIVARIERTIHTTFAELPDTAIQVRGRGALWMLELPSSVNVGDVVSRILQRGVLVSSTSRYIRLLPAATISLTHLATACTVVRDECLRSIRLHASHS